MLPKGVAVALQTAAIDGSEGDGDAGAHAPEIAWRKPVGIPVADSTDRLIHQVLLAIAKLVMASETGFNFVV